MYPLTQGAPTDAEDPFAPRWRHPCTVLPHRRVGLAEDPECGDGGADRALRPEEESRGREDRPRPRRLLDEQGRPALADREVAAQEARQSNTASVILSRADGEGSLSGRKILRSAQDDNHR